MKSPPSIWNIVTSYIFYARTVPGRVKYSSKNETLQRAQNAGLKIRMIQKPFRRGKLVNDIQRF